MLEYILAGFSNEMEKMALSRYAIEDHTDQTDSQFLHRGAGSSTYEAGTDYVPPSKKHDKKKIKKPKYADKGNPNSDHAKVEGIDQSTEDLDYQTSRALLPDFAPRDYK